MFWQLDLAYGEHFYPNLHQMYRLLPESEMPASDEDKKQMFIYMASKAAKQNLVPFFEKWGLGPNDEVRGKIENLNLPKLEKEIWLSTDSNPIREKQTEPYEVPYGEPNDTKIQNVAVGTTYDEKKANELVQNLGESVKVTGVIIQDKPGIGEKTVKVEIIDKKGNKNLIPVVVNVGYGDGIIFQGDGDTIRSIVTANHNTKKLQATSTDSKVHYRFEKEKYMGLAIYDKNGNEKKRVIAEGQETSKNFANQLNGLDFVYGDVVEVYHAESDRLNWYQNNEFVGKGKGETEQKLYFKITEQGFERLEAQQEVKAVPQKVVIGTDAEKLEAKNFVQVKDGEVIGFVERPDTTKIGEQTVKVETKDYFGNKEVTEVPLEVIYGDSLVFQGNGNTTRSVVTADHNTKKLQATSTDSKVHYRFEKEKYMGITLYDQNGNEKKVISVEGQETAKNFAEQLNGVNFAYGDVIKVYHAESDRLKWYQKNEFVSSGKGKQELYFEITEKGFEKLESLQEVTAVPQKVVIGIDAEKLEAKDFVQVKDGEVIGFVEKPNTTKIGEQKVKVETKDRFGNKKVTEVPVEVTYGDSIVYQGLSNVVRSIVTLNHEDKKLHVTSTDEQIHSYFKNELYMGITLYDQNGTEKKHVTAEGQETSKNFAEQVNGTPFEYGDVIEVYHAEPSRLKWYKKSKLEEQLASTKVSFKVTQSGLEQVKGI